MRKRTVSSGFTESPYFSEALQVAYYHCVLEMPLKSIAEILGKSPATITRRLDEVRQAGWLRDHPEFRPPPLAFPIMTGLLQSWLGQAV